MPIRPRYGTDGLLAPLTSRCWTVRRGVELAEHLGEKGDPAGHSSVNNHNRATSKTVLTDIGGPEVAVTLPRDRNGSFEPKIVPKRPHRLQALRSLWHA